MLVDFDSVVGLLQTVCKHMLLTPASLVCTLLITCTVIPDVDPSCVCPYSRMKILCVFSCVRRWLGDDGASLEMEIAESHCATLLFVFSTWSRAVGQCFTMLTQLREVLYWTEPRVRSYVSAGRNVDLALSTGCSAPRTLITHYCV